MASTGLLLHEVRLERFKAAFEPGPVPLGGFTVITGRNGSGKSTVVEALQWIDSALRRDAGAACDRYEGIADLVNYRSRSKVPSFRLACRWRSLGGNGPAWRYEVSVGDDDGLPKVIGERLDDQASVGAAAPLIETALGARWVLATTREEQGVRVLFGNPRKLALGEQPIPEALALRDFWSRAVFLRLSPHRLADGAPARRRSGEPLLDEEGRHLPALLNDLTVRQRNELIQSIQQLLPGMHGINVSNTDAKQEAAAYYSLTERMPYRGRAGRRLFDVPAWMLSEGTRRLTAILALLVCQPRPSLLCIEEVENGLDPWTCRQLLRHLRSAAAEGVQVVVTTHSPWLLDDVPLDSIVHVRRVDGDTCYTRLADRQEIQEYDSAVPPGTRYVQEEPA